MSEPGLQIAYGAGAEPDGRPLGRGQHSVSIFADRLHVRAAMADDAEAAGLRLVSSGDLSRLGDDPDAVLGDFVLLDIPTIDPHGMAMLCQLDMRAARGGTGLVVSTNLDALDAVFGCLNQSRAQILIDPSRAERVLAISRAAMTAGLRSVHELSEEDRFTLLRLSQQVEEMGRKLEKLSGAMDGHDPEPEAFRFESPALAFRHATASPGDRLVRAARPALPDPRLIRRILRQRQLRSRFFENDLFADPAWDMLLDLTAARAEHLRVSVTSLCIASAVPPTTALRWITQMTEMGLMERLNDETDRRRAFITLTDKAADAMARYFAELGGSAVMLV